MWMSAGALIMLASILPAVPPHHHLCMVLATQSFTVLFHPFVTDVEVPAAFVPSRGDTAVLQWADSQFGAAVRIGLSLCSSGKVSCVAANLWCRFIVRHRAAACHSDTQHGAESCALLQASLLSENRGIVLG